jgi:hypothetical protein
MKAFGYDYLVDRLGKERRGPRMDTYQGIKVSSLRIQCNERPG